MNAGFFFLFIFLFLFNGDTKVINVAVQNLKNEMNKSKCNSEIIFSLTFSIKNKLNASVKVISFRKF